MNANNSQAYETGYEAHEQGEPRSNVTAHYAAGTWESGQWIDGWEAAQYSYHNPSGEEKPT